VEDGGLRVCCKEYVSSLARDGGIADRGLDFSRHPVRRDKEAMEDGGLRSCITRYVVSKPLAEDGIFADHYRLDFARHLEQR